MASWADHVTSLREITGKTILAALDDHPPVTARNLPSALHTLFQPSNRKRSSSGIPREISLPAMRRLPAPIPTDQLRGLIGRADSPMAKLIVALVAIHALGKQETAPAAAGRSRHAGRTAARPPPRRPGPHGLPRRTHPHPGDRMGTRSPTPGQAVSSRLDAYAQIQIPVILLGGRRSPAHLGTRLDALARTVPHAEKVMLPRQGHGANQRAPGDVARVIETLADKVLR